MVKVESHGTWWLVENVVYFGDERDASSSLKLLTTQGDAVRYWSAADGIIDFPGEYDVNGITVRGWLAWWMMSYLMKTEKTSVALVANAAVLDVAAFDEAEDVLCLNQEASEEAEKMELSGTIQLFADAAWWGSDATESSDLEQSATAEE